MTKSSQSKIFQLLQYNKKHRGRALTKSVPELGLLKGHRLMASPDMPNVADFELREVPFRIGGLHDRVLHDNPLLMVEGFGLQSFSIDLMHTWHLGPTQPLVSLALHCCLDAQILNPNAFSLNAADRQKVGLMAIKSELFQW